MSKKVEFMMLKNREVDEHGNKVIFWDDSLGFTRSNGEFVLDDHGLNFFRTAQLRQDLKEMEHKIQSDLLDGHEPKQHFSQLYKVTEFEEGIKF